jgi:thiol-disulfide isomerase/thioredoxin
MQKSARFAATFLSVVISGSVLAADLRSLKDPAKIDDVFPRTAKIRLLNVWATWCIPCVIEMPDLRAVDEAFGDELAVAGVSLDDMIPGAKAETVENFLDRYRIVFPNVYYTGNLDDLADTMKINGEIPVTIVYDANGKELWRHQGKIDRKETIARLRELLKK